jgi:hypothetical protein
MSNSQLVCAAGSRTRPRRFWSVHDPARKKRADHRRFFSLPHDPFSLGEPDPDTRGDGSGRLIPMPSGGPCLLFPSRSGCPSFDPHHRDATRIPPRALSPCQRASRGGLDRVSRWVLWFLGKRLLVQTAQTFPETPHEEREHGLGETNLRSLGNKGELLDERARCKKPARSAQRFRWCSSSAVYPWGLASDTGRQPSRGYPFR